MKRLLRRAAVMGAVAALAYGIGACSEKGQQDQSGTGGGGIPTTTAPGNPLSREDGGTAAGNLGDGGSRGDVNRRLDAGMGRGTDVRRATPDAGTP